MPQAGPPLSQEPAAIKAGNMAYQVAVKQLGKPYVYGAVGPDSFDCSGLMYFSYQTGPGSPGVEIGRDTTAQWNNTTVMTTVYDAVTQAGTPLDPNTLEVGDLILYFQPGNSGENAHVKMYAGGGQTIEAPYTGAVVKMSALDLVGDSIEPLRGVKRVLGGGSAGVGPPAPASPGGDNTAQGSPTAGAKAYPGVTPKAGALPDLSKKEGKKEALAIALQNLPDPRNNLPFSAFFTGAKVVGTPSGRGSKSTSAPLVRGGMVELLTNSNVTGPDAGNPLKANLKPRPGGQFACYFMMNPATISTDCSMTTDVTAPSQTDPTALQQGPYWVQNQTISFELIFNRMYEVWQGGVNNPNPARGKRGPSALGVRWDIRSIERLMGIYDAQADYPNSKGKLSGNTGLGAYGAGDRPPQAMPLQVVFGGDSSIQFQGLIASMNYTYTLFDVNMIPIEATVDISIMRMYLPNLAGDKMVDIISPMVSNMGQMGTVFTTGSTSPFNTPTLSKP